MGYAKVVEIKEGKLLQFPVKKEEDVIVKLPKLTKSGDIKKTPNNTKENRDGVQPIKESDVPRIVKYYKDKADNANSERSKDAAIRDMCLVIIGVNIALRISDLLTLKWSDVYNSDWTFKTGRVIKPKKTENSNKHVLLKFNTDFKNTIEYYKNYLKHVDNINNYIFEGNDEGHISDATVEHSLKLMAKELELLYNLNTHSFRKAFCRWRYDHAENKSEVLVQLMVLLGHSSIDTTKHYLCITEEETEALFNSISIGFEYIEQ